MTDKRSAPNAMNPFKKCKPYEPSSSTTTPKVPKDKNASYIIAKQFTHGKSPRHTWDNFANREVIVEKNFNYSEICQGYPVIFQGRLDFFSSKRWDALLSPTVHGYETLTKLWYSGMKMEDGTLSVTIGKFKIPELSNRTIISALGILNDDEMLLEDTVEYPSSYLLKEVHQSIYHCYSEEAGCATIRKKHLLKTLFHIFIYEFAYSNLIPQKANHNMPTVALDEVVYILTTKNVDIGEIILHHMWHAHNTKKHVLPYASLITRILLKEGYQLPNPLGEEALIPKEYGRNSFMKMMNAGAKSREEGITQFANPDAATSSTQQVQTQPPPLQRPQFHPCAPMPNMDQFTNLFAGLQTFMGERFTHIDTQVHGIAQRMDNIDGRFANMEGLFTETRQDVENMRLASSTHFQEIDDRMNHMDDSLSHLEQAQRYIYDNIHASTYTGGGAPPSYDEISGRAPVRGDDYDIDDYDSANED